MLDLIDVESVEIRLPDKLKNVDGLIIPGGESTTLTKLLKATGLFVPLKEFSETKAPRCIRYNEMYDLDWTMKEITETKSNLVICHHNNDGNYQNIS